jgi:excisionase family DNA binding protein
MENQSRRNVESERDALHSLDKVARRFDVSIWTIRKWCQEGRLASVRLGARRLITESEVQRVISEGLREAR